MEPFRAYEYLGSSRVMPMTAASPGTITGTHTVPWAVMPFVAPPSQITGTAPMPPGAATGAASPPSLSMTPLGRSGYLHPWQLGPMVALTTPTPVATRITGTARTLPFALELDRGEHTETHIAHPQHHAGAQWTARRPENTEPFSLVLMTLVGGFCLVCWLDGRRWVRRTTSSCRRCEH